MVTIEGKAGDTPPPCRQLPARSSRQISFPVRPVGREGYGIATRITPATKEGGLAITCDGVFQLGQLITVREPRLTLNVTDLDQPAPSITADLDAIVQLAGHPFQVSGPPDEGGAFVIKSADSSALSVRPLLESLLGALPAQFSDLTIDSLAFGADLSR